MQSALKLENFIKFSPLKQLSADSMPPFPSWSLSPLHLDSYLL